MTAIIQNLIYELWCLTLQWKICDLHSHCLNAINADGARQ